MAVSRRSFALSLALTPGVGGKTVSKVLARNDLVGRSPEEFLSLSPEAFREEYRLTSKVASAIASKGIKLLEQSKDMESKLNRLGVTWVCLADVHYPRQIEAFDPDPPGALFLYGNSSLLNRKTFSVLSSRNATEAGLERIEKLAEQGVLASEVLVCGHDRLEYQRAAVVPLRWGAPRILVLDRGLFTALGEELSQEPFASARLWRYQFDPKTDLVVTPVKPRGNFVGVTNKVRDALIAGLSQRIDFPHLAKGGNMERIAQTALRAGKPIRVDANSEVGQALLKFGAARLDLESEKG